jgi:hypothetical protein
MKHVYNEIIDGITFTGTYDIEEDDAGFPPIITVTQVFIGYSQDLMLVIDSWVIQTIESRIQRK